MRGEDTVSTRVCKKLGAVLRCRCDACSQKSLHGVRLQQPDTGPRQCVGE